MNIKRICITKLFGLTDNNIDVSLHYKDPITILFGFNGIGKTTIIKLIEACMTCNLTILRTHIFENITIIFEDNTEIIVNRDMDFHPGEDIANCWIGLSGMKYHPIKYIYKDQEGKEYDYIFELKETEEINIINDDFKITERYIYTFDDKDFFSDDGLHSYNSLCKLLKTKAKIITLFVPKEFPHISNNYSYGKKISENDETVFLSIEQLHILQERVKIAIKVDEEYPKEDIKIYEKATSELIPLNIPFSDKLDDIAAFFIDNYNDPTYFSRFQLFTKILNENFGFLYKEIIIDPIKGLSCKPVCNQDEEFSYKKLSVGEKKLISIFYELLYKTDEESTIFIDEPETSLHLDWQKALVKSIDEICKIIKLQVIIMTHSPDVIDNYFMFAHELKSERFKNAKFFKN